MLVPLYIAAIGLVMLASAVWRYRQRDMVGMAASLVMAFFALGGLRSQIVQSVTFRLRPYGCVPDISA
ncbi:MAG: hypothetical protein E5V89_12590 [Mesorhizobium sp.]|uniref:hypothetical protein n=1 Tax=Mesorhizobium sp. TaxID=1871066 RepID=UPI000FE975AE|nr:hypothetical protein [Mesorhizobium sp.]RWD64283.1 MAG: hypothetical protein EOS36_10395 [Mesorhizobium sp.]RWE38731.1 MAG: hypothetical protein EOS79_22605 [Mesorhizobium sp.]TIV70876.1 MAG: hypothetical protein E5V89_12590 [Mesorhizobium sp.]TIV99014.1 MAG: hypothetical protein E5V85_09270 [Mesorhizobium sp.]